LSLAILGLEFVWLDQSKLVWRPNRLKLVFGHKIWRRVFFPEDAYFTDGHFLVHRVGFVLDGVNGGKRVLVHGEELLCLPVGCVCHMSFVKVFEKLELFLIQCASET